MLQRYIDNILEGEWDGLSLRYETVALSQS